MLTFLIMTSWVFGSSIFFTYFPLVPKRVCNRCPKIEHNMRNISEGYDLSPSCVEWRGGLI